MNETPPWHFERDPIPYALETDWPVEAGGFEPLHFGIRSDAVDHGLTLFFGTEVRRRQYRIETRPR